MSSERDCNIYMAQILNQTDRQEEMIKCMKRAIEINPDLSEDERALLNVAYKQAITPLRNGIRYLQTIEDDPAYQKTSDECKEKISDIITSVTNELFDTCNDLISLCDEKLLPAATTPESKVYYLKLKADYFRYIAEAQNGEDRNKTAEDATKYYTAALEISRKELPQYTPTALGLILNFTVFLYEIAEKREDAIKIAKETHEKTQPHISDNDEKNIDEAMNILSLLATNINQWEEARS